MIELLLLPLSIPNLLFDTLYSFPEELEVSRDLLFNNESLINLQSLMLRDNRFKFAYRMISEVFVRYHLSSSCMLTRLPLIV